MLAVHPVQADDFDKLIDDKTKAVYVEAIGNPAYNVPDFEAIAAVAHKHGGQRSTAADKDATLRISCTVQQFHRSLPLPPMPCRHLQYP